MTKERKKKLANLLMWMDLKIMALRDKITSDGIMALLMLGEPDFEDDKKRHALVSGYLDEFAEEPK